MTSPRPRYSRSKEAQDALDESASVLARDSGMRAYRHWCDTRTRPEPQGLAMRRAQSYTDPELAAEFRIGWIVAARAFDRVLDGRPCAVLQELKLGRVEVVYADGTRARTRTCYLRAAG